MEPIILPKKNDRFFLEALMEHWPILVFLVGIVVSWTHFQSSLAELTKQFYDTQTRVSNVEASTQTANVNYAALSGKIDTTNGKLDILLKANHLQ